MYMNTSSIISGIIQCIIVHNGHSARTILGACPMSIPSSLKNLHTGGVNRSMRDAIEKALRKNSAYVISPL